MRNRALWLALGVFACVACADDDVPDAGDADARDAGEMDAGEADADLDASEDTSAPDMTNDAPTDSAPDAIDAGVARVDLYVAVGGDDDAVGSEEAPLATVREAVARANASSERITVHVGAGGFPVMGELRIRAPMVIVGESPERSRIELQLTRDEAGIRVLASDVSLRDLDVSVYLVHSLGDGVHVGGRGEYGTGITLGEYLSTEPHAVVSNIELRRLRISRLPREAPEINYVAAALTMVGRVHDVIAEDLELRGRHSTATILHWGGHSTVAPSPSALADPEYRLFETYHPHDIVIRDVRIERVARFAVISSSYDVVLDDFRGVGETFFDLLPGDEGGLYAAEDERALVNTGLDVGHFVGELIARSADYAIKVSAMGTSKVRDDGFGEVVPFPMRDVTLHDFTVTRVTRPGGQTFRYGIDATGMRGENVRFQNIELSDLASRDFVDVGDPDDPDDDRILPSYGVFAARADGLRFEGIRSRARYGVGLRDSCSLQVASSRFEYLATESELVSTGAFLREEETPSHCDAGSERASFEDVEIIGYDRGIRYPAPDTCARYAFRDVRLMGNGVDQFNGACLE